MSDDTKAVVDKHGCLRYLAAFQSMETKVQLDDLRSLLADRDALAAENASLREALRKATTWAAYQAYGIVRHGCDLCQSRWTGNAEIHHPGCLAAPRETT